MLKGKKKHISEANGSVRELIVSGSSLFRFSLVFLTFYAFLYQSYYSPGRCGGRGGTVNWEMFLFGRWCKWKWTRLVVAIPSTRPFTYCYIAYVTFVSLFIFPTSLSAQRRISLISLPKIQIQIYKYLPDIAAIYPSYGVADLFIFSPAYRCQKVWVSTADVWRRLQNGRRGVEKRKDAGRRQ